MIITLKELNKKPCSKCQSIKKKVYAGRETIELHCGDCENITHIKYKKTIS